MFLLLFLLLLLFLWLFLFKGVWGLIKSQFLASACKHALVFGFTLKPVLGTAAYHTTDSHLWKKLWKPLYNEVALHDAERCLKKLLF